MTVITKAIGRLPINKGNWDANFVNPKTGIAGYGKKFRAIRYGCELESKIENNTYDPITWDGSDTFAIDETHWLLVSGNPQNWLDGQDKQATSEQYPFNGMGRVVLKKNMVNGVNTLTQDMFYKGEAGSRVPNTNTIYVIQYDFTLGEDITVPANCVLEFDGGSISGNKTLTGNNTGISAGLVKIFNIDITFAGSWNVAEGYPEWVGTIVNSQSGTCVARAINKLYEFVDTVVLPLEGQYFSYSGNTINVKGKLKGCRTGRAYNNGTVGTYIICNNISNGQSAILVGVSGGTVADRVKTIYIENVTVRVDSNNLNKSCAIEIGAVSTIHLTNVYALNLNYRQSALTSEERQAPAEHCNYGIMFNGDSEFVEINNCTFEGSLAMYCKKSTDFFDAYTLCCITENNYGFAAIYGVIGSAVHLKNVSLNQGEYGVYLTKPPYPFVMDGFRIEQLIAGGTNFYIEGNGDVYPPKIILQNGVLNNTCNGIIVKGTGTTNVYNNAIVIVDKVTSIIGGSSESNCYIIDLSESSKWNALFKNCNISTFAKVSIQSSYSIFGLECNQNDTIGYHIENAKILHLPTLSVLRNKRYTLEGNVYRGKAIDKMAYIDATHTSTSDASAVQHHFKMTESNNTIIAYICDIKVYGNNVWGRIRLLTKYNVVDGVIQNSITRRVLSKEGDDIFSTSHQEGKITYDTASTGTGLSIFNHVQDNLIMETDVTLIVQP